MLTSGHQNRHFCSCYWSFLCHRCGKVYSRFAAAGRLVAGMWANACGYGVHPECTGSRCGIFSRNNFEFYLPNRKNLNSVGNSAA